jgi:hypothetical protein
MKTLVSFEDGFICNIIFLDIAKVSLLFRENGFYNGIDIKAGLIWEERLLWMTNIWS